MSSQEHRTNEIMQMYGNILGRAPDAAGLQHYLQLMAQGTTRPQIEQLMYGSNEFKTSDAAVMKDPAYAAFARRAQLQEAEAQNDLAAFRDEATSAMRLQAGRYDQQRQDVARGHDRDFESRGMFRAGERIKRTADDQARVTFEQQNYELGQRSALAQRERATASTIAALKRQRAEEAVSARQRLTQRAAERAYT